MNYILLDIHWRKLLPLCFGRPIGKLLIGMKSIEDRWENLLQSPIINRSVTYLHDSTETIPKGPCIIINSALLPDAEVLTALLDLKPGEGLYSESNFLAGHFNSFDEIVAEQALNEGSKSKALQGLKTISYPNSVRILNRPADIFAYNDVVLRNDLDTIGAKLPNSKPNGAVHHTGSQLYIHPSALIRPCYINTETGPVIISAEVEVMEGAMLRGPLFLGRGTTVKMGTKIYGATSIGEHCRVGGELSNVVMQAYSNKGHDGFLGNSVIGSWCNLGADTNTSNLKNNYSKVRVWSYDTENQEATGLQFHGLIMGDYSKAGINTMFNTGSVIGMHANVFNAGFPIKFIPSFSWVDGLGKPETFRMEKAIEAANAMMERRGMHLSDRDLAIFQRVMEYDQAQRQQLGMLA